MPNKTLTPEQVLGLLAETPVRIAALTAALSAAQLHSPAGQDEWSANDVLAHVRACADVWGGCMLTIATQDRPTLRAVNPLTWIRKTDYPELPFQRSLRAFARQRAELLPVLERLPRQGWSRTATVTGAGSVLVRDVLFYGRWMAGHERVHVKQIARIVQESARLQGPGAHDLRKTRQSPARAAGVGTLAERLSGSSPARPISR